MFWKALIVGSLLFLMTGVVGCASLSTEPEMVVVERVIDGDTVVTEGGQRIRYIGIDSPEVGSNPEPLAIEAMEANRRLVEGKRVRLEKNVSETDAFGRLLRYVWVDGTMVNRELVKLGLARSVAYPPDTRYQTVFDDMEKEARRAGRGMWAK